FDHWRFNKRVAKARHHALQFGGHGGGFGNLRRGAVIKPWRAADLRCGHKFGFWLLEFTTCVDHSASGIETKGSGSPNPALFRLAMIDMMDQSAKSMA